MDVASGLLKQQLKTDRRLRKMVTKAEPLSHGYWMAANETWTYENASSFTITDSTVGEGTADYTSMYQAGDFIRLKQGGAFLYFMISAVTYSDPTTTVTIDKNITGGGSVLANAAITDNYYSKAWSPQGCGPTRFTLGYFTSTDWDGDAKNGADGILDLSALFGVPAGIKAISANMLLEDETVGVAGGLSKTNVNINEGIRQITQAANNFITCAGIIPCDDNGDVYWTQSGELDSVFIYITGYWS